MHYNKQEDRIELSVRELCAMALRRGNLDNRVPPSALYRRADEGREVHEKLRALRERGVGLESRREEPVARPRGSEEAFFSVEDLPKAAYHAEVTLHHVSRLEEVTISVSGRADGVWYDPLGGCVVEEIKSVNREAELYAHPPREADLAQLTCYGYFLCAAKDLSSVTLRLTYVQAGHEEEAVCVDSVMSAEQLKAAYAAILHMILPRARDMAEREKIDIRLYRVIYQAIEDVEAAMKGMLAPKYKEVLLGHATVRQPFRVSGVGTIAGSYVTDGKIARNAQIRLLRDNIVIHEGKIDSLKRFKDDAKEVNTGYECGIGIENYNDIKENDVIECFIMEEIER